MRTELPGRTLAPPPTYARPGALVICARTRAGANPPSSRRRRWRPLQLQPSTLKRRRTGSMRQSRLAQRADPHSQIVPIRGDLQPRFASSCPFPCLGPARRRAPALARSGGRSSCVPWVRQNASVRAPHPRHSPPAPLSLQAGQISSHPTRWRGRRHRSPGVACGRRGSSSPRDVMTTSYRIRSRRSPPSQREWHVELRAFLGQSGVHVMVTLGWKGDPTRSCGPNAPALGRTRFSAVPIQRRQAADS